MFTMEIDLKANQEKFENLLRTEIKRDGVERLIEYLKSSDFYTAPATTQYGLSVEGGLWYPATAWHKRLPRQYPACGYF